MLLTQMDLHHFPNPSHPSVPSLNLTNAIYSEDRLFFFNYMCYVCKHTII